jgi:hypothetical protein
MNYTKRIIIKITVLALAIVSTSLTGHGQGHFAQSGSTKISIDGTSTIHEWAMVSKDATYDAVFETNGEGQPLKLTSLDFSLPAESLKSGKSAMDKNAYSALKTDTHKQIVFQLTSASIVGKTIRCNGKLKIAGTTKQIELEVTYLTLPGNSIQCKGTKKISMSEYNVEPPTFMFGSVTTGNEITISIDVTLAPKDLKSVTLN